jgi:hypothetical protein
MRTLILAILGLALASCTTPSDSVGLDGSPDTATDSHGLTDLATPGDVADVVVPEDIAEVFDFADRDGLDSALDLPVNPGEFLSPCAANDDCLSGFCVWIGPEKRCTVQCLEDCPQGFSCGQAGPGPDLVYICIPTHRSLCVPCQTAEDCAMDDDVVGGVCISYGDEGAFCGDYCGNCPEGYSCQEMPTVTGEMVETCTPVSGLCACPPYAAKVGATTHCFATNEFGSCPGQRMCGNDGLTQCDADQPMAEWCNSHDDDCDGDVDEGTSGSDCLVINSYGACPGVESCVGGLLSCQGDEAQMEKCDGDDNDCDGLVDEGFADTDNDGIADCLENDKDGDGIADGVDNCPTLFNPQQTDTDFDSLGDACDLDDDNDQTPDAEDCSPKNAAVHPGAVEICDGLDNDCDYTVDEGSPDFDFDGFKDCVDDDDDNDGTVDGLDCGPTNADVHPGATEWCDGLDNDCDGQTDEGASDIDQDGLADCVDDDMDGDGASNPDDNCPLVANQDQSDADLDGLGDACDLDLDGDGIPDSGDNCLGLKNPLQQDLDGDGLGDGCDDDLDGDTLANDADNCPLVANDSQLDTDDDGVGDACEDDTDGDGTPDAKDCAPEEAAIHPEADEACDGLDNNCNSLIDEGFVDTDADSLKDCVDDDDDNDGTHDEQDCQPLNAAIHPGAGETCNGLDDDCNDSIDDGLGKTTCGKGQCAHAVANCIDGKTTNCDPFEGATYESCDGLDNDCNGLVDEGLGFATCGKGECFHTVATCQEGVPVDCDPLEGAAPELCDGADNDCDGKTDEEQPILACGKGQCFHTVASCQGGVSYECNPFEGASPEVCDTVDNDCDGEADEGLGQTTCGFGACQHTVDNCIEGAFQICNPMAGAAVEVCDGEDNDCDSLVDEDLGILTCGFGVCSVSVAGCIGGVPQECLPLDTATDEICDGLDNNCDGFVDEGLALLTCGQGICLHTVQGCIGGVPQNCDPLAAATDEECDGLDNDCDGQTDEGFDDTDSDGKADCVDDDDDGDTVADSIDNCPLVFNTGQENFDNDDEGDDCDLDDDNDGDPDATDCEPNNNEIFHGNTEVCLNNLDDNCNDVIDDEHPCLKTTCLDVLTANPQAVSGIHIIDPDGDGGAEPFKVYCDMESHGGGWTMCYTEKDDMVHFKTQVTYDPAKPFGSVGYRSDCRNIPFNAVLYVNHDSGQKAWFQRDSGGKFTMASMDYFTSGEQLGHWTAKAVATTGYKYQLNLCDGSGGMWVGLMMSGYTNCWKQCGSWCGDTQSPYFRHDGTDGGSYNGVAFNQNGHTNVTYKTMSVGVR